MNYVKEKVYEIIAAECMPDHVHMFVSIPPKYSVSEIMGYLKGKSSLMIFDRHANLKYKYGNRHFWCRVYYVDTVGKNAKKIEEYVKNQMQEDNPCTHKYPEKFDITIIIQLHKLYDFNELYNLQMLI